MAGAIADLLTGSKWRAVRAAIGSRLAIGRKSLPGKGFGSDVGTGERLTGTINLNRSEMQYRVSVDRSRSAGPLRNTWNRLQRGEQLSSRAMGP